MLTILLALATVLEAQNFNCPNAQPKGVCAKGETKYNTFKRVLAANIVDNDKNIYSCKLTKGEVEAHYCCPTDAIAVVSPCIKAPR
ncbi:hypothetical protein PCANC_00461 [Puccinia coronata f. sp. avenae]|uniref:Hydrophobin n=1 Tax=Puccinia coronata f. sp. avenae TaxID=200324 RepID=A0A2N5W7Z2_9BASI|nr:hypothetical protein PCANC_00461 [Puccinia coronata f. sp. avenae]